MSLTPEALTMRRDELKKVFDQKVGQIQQIENALRQAKSDLDALSGAMMLANDLLNPGEKSKVADLKNPTPRNIKRRARRNGK